MAKRMRRIYKAKNGVVEGSDFWISDSAQPRRGKAKASSARKQEANRNQAAHILGRKLNNNFSQGDLFLTLTWNDKAFRALKKTVSGRQVDGPTETGDGRKGKKRTKAEEKRDSLLLAAEKEGKRFIRRIREAGARDCRYMILASDMDGDTKDEVRVHVHVILSGEQVTQARKELRICGKELKEFWSFGAVDYEFLRGGSYSKLAAYLIRQTRDIPNHKKYACSRNLEACEFEEIELGPNAEPLQAPAGVKVEEYQHDPTNPYGMVYIRYVDQPGEARDRKKRKRE